MASYIASIKILRNVVKLATNIHVDFMVSYSLMALESYVLASIGQTYDHFVQEIDTRSVAKRYVRAMRDTRII